MALMKTRSLAHLLEQIHQLSSSELKRQTALLAEREHQQGARLIAHLAEVSMRRLHLELGYRSLFDYCSKRLGLSEGCTWLRIQVSRVCNRHPQILDALAGQQISLTVAGKLAPHLKTENCERLIADCTGMTRREVEEYLVHLAPKPAVSPGARQVLPAPKKSGSAEPCQPDIYNLRFAADQGFMDKLSRAAEVGGMGNACRNMARVFEVALDAYLQKNDPKKRQERREKRAALKEKVTAEPVASADAARSRTIPSSLRDRLLIRAGHRCEYRSSDGLRCSERSRLTIDHIVPWGLGGTSEAGNLRVLCFAHNRLHADRCFGAEFMNQKIESARSMSAQKAVSSQTAQRRPGGYHPPRPDEVANPDRVGEPATIYRASGSRRGTGPLRPIPDPTIDRVSRRFCGARTALAGCGSARGLLQFRSGIRQRLLRCTAGGDGVFDRPGPGVTP